MIDDLPVTLHLTHDQARALVDACDLAYRVASGQWRDVVRYASTNNSETIAYARKGIRDCPVFAAIMAARALAMPDLNDDSAAYGIGCQVLHADIKRLNAVGEQVRRAMAYHRHPDGGMTVDFDETLNLQPAGEPLPECEVRK